MGPYFSILFSVFLFAVAIRNLWPQKMSAQAFAALYVPMACAALPIPLLTHKQYGLFCVLLVVCAYGLTAYRDTRPQNICMGISGCVLALILVNVATGLESALFPQTLRDGPLGSIFIMAFETALFYAVSLVCGKAVRQRIISRKGFWQIRQVWYLIDAALLLFLIVFFFHTGIRSAEASAAGLVYYNALLVTGYLLVAAFLLLSMLRTYRERLRAQARQRAFADLQDYTRSLEAMYERLRSFKHDYVNILTSLSGYIESGDMDALREYFEAKILPTQNLIAQGDYKLNQLGNIAVVEIKSLLSAKMIYAHEKGIDVAIDIPAPVSGFAMDTVDLARILGIFLDNAVEAALETEHPAMGLNILQNENTVAVTIHNSVPGGAPALHKLKQPGFTTKAGHTGIGLANAQKLLRLYRNIVWETAVRDGRFTQYLEIAGGSGEHA